jgi:hypothetical protein
MKRFSLFTASIKNIPIRGIVTTGLLSTAIGVLSSSDLSAQVIGGGNGNSLLNFVGGVSIDSDGVAKNVSDVELSQWVANDKKAIQGPSDVISKDADTRYVSLKLLSQELAKANAEHRTVAEDIQYVGGLTRVEYILLYPEHNDIVLAGPGEAWKLGEHGAVVGAKSGQPMMNVEDLIVAFAQLNTAQPQAISCSIEPTPEGSLKLNELLSQIGSIPAGESPAVYEPAMKEAFGPQQVLIRGVESETHLARVMFAADYQMKRIGMALKDSPVRGLSSYVDMIRHAKAPKQPSRWWFACNYDAVEKSEDALAWRITGSGLKVLTEQEVIQASGERVGTGGEDKIAAKWAETFTSKIDQLSVEEPSIGQLRTVMDLCVAAAVIRTHNLEKLANCDLSSLGSISIEQPASVHGPKSVEPQCSFVKAGKDWTITASGGVMIDPWSTVSAPQVSPSLSEVRSATSPEARGGMSWSWN